MINKFSILNRTKYFSSEIYQNCLAFISAKKYIKYFSGTTWNDSRKSSGISDKNIENTTKSYSSFPPIFVDHHILSDINFNGHCLINNNISILKKVIKLYTSYIINRSLKNLNTYFTLKNCLFGSVNLTKNSDSNKYKYSD